MESKEFLINYENVNLITAGTRPRTFSDINRLNWRAQALLVQNKAAIKGKRVLDLACNNGKFSYGCLELGVKHVTGVEGRAQIVERAKEFMRSKASEEQWHFLQDDVFDYLASVKPGTFDTILCFGFLYHTTRQLDFFKEIKRIKPANVIVDTAVYKKYFSFNRRGFNKPASLVFITEDHTLERITTEESDIVALPTKSFLEYMFELHGFSCQEISFKKAGIKNWMGLKDYKNGHRTAYIAEQKS
jgi:2-polyprenyl-3-methyl-5-hydroxy-6-metoxy-1,4-benzoquinol methylase